MSERSMGATTCSASTARCCAPMRMLSFDRLVDQFLRQIFASAVISDWSIV